MSNSSSSDDSIDESDDQNSSSTTTSTATRHRFTNDLLAVLLVAATVGLAAAYASGHASVTQIPLPIASVLSLSTLTAVAWAFGPEMLAEASKARSSGQE